MIIAQQHSGFRHLRHDDALHRKVLDDLETSQAELMVRLTNRDPEALAAIYDRYARAVYSLFLRITHDRPTAEDLVQELFLRLWNQARQFNPQKGIPEVWILSVARNMALDHVRAGPAKFRARLPWSEEIEQLTRCSSFVEPESILARSERIAVAMSSFDPREKEVLELAYFEGYSQSEIANLLQQPLGTVKSWMRSALSRLRLALDPVSASIRDAGPQPDDRSGGSQHVCFDSPRAKSRQV